MPIEALPFLRNLFDAAVQCALPQMFLRDALPPVPRGRTVVIGAGKAAATMAQAVERLWPLDAPMQGVVVTRYGHVPPNVRVGKRRIEVLEAAHPVPDAAGLAATLQIRKVLDGLTSDDLVLCLISGGASALLWQPVQGLDMTEKQRINRELLRCGASIHEMNCVRKHLSQVKGGHLAAECAPAKLVTLAISDVPGDNPAVIGSGPTVADPSTCADALRIADHYGIELPAELRHAWRLSLHETPKPGDDIFTRSEIRVLATPWASLQAAADVARSAGVAAHILSDAIEGESCEVAKVHAAIALSVAQRGSPFVAPCVLLSGGETTVSLPRVAPEKGWGRGGRAGEFGLGLVGALNSHPRIWALAADTDGIDGVENNAGVLVTPDTLDRAKSLDLSLRHYIDRHDAYGYFSHLEQLLVTGPTFTNVNDFRAILIL